MKKTKTHISVKERERYEKCSLRLKPATRNDLKVAAAQRGDLEYVLAETILAEGLKKILKK